MKVSSYYIFTALLVFVLGWVSYRCGSGSKKNTTSEIRRLDPDKMPGAVATAQKTLLGALQKGLSQGSPAQAVTYCNERALSVTDSLSQALGLVMRRTALRWRNPANRPDSVLTEILTQWESEIQNGVVPQPRFAQAPNGHERYVAPIILKPLCLNCHGNPETGEVTPETLAEIHRLYPEDHALGFKVGDLRGAWVIEAR